MEKIIIDTDPGTDDFIAISLALESNKFDVLGITTVEGNCTLENATKNAFKTLNMCERDDIEVYKGLENDYLGTVSATHVHGNNGMGGVEYTPINRQENEMNAIDYLIDTVNSNPNEITVVAVGPLTNIAACIEKNNDFAKNVKQLVIMGGSASYGNVTPYAEFNFYKDPKSADTVLKADFNSILIFGWDITTKMPITPEKESILKNSEKEIPRFIYNITRVAAEGFDKKYGGAVISDALTIAYLIDENVSNLSPAKVRMVLDGEQAGKSEVEFVQESNIKFATSVDTERFFEILFDAIL